MSSAQKVDMPEGNTNLNSTKNISPTVLEEIKQALLGLDFGSVEIYVQNSEVVQVTKRVIKKILKPVLTNNRKVFIQYLAV